MLSPHVRQESASLLMSYVQWLLLYTFSGLFNLKYLSFKTKWFTSTLDLIADEVCKRVVTITHLYNLHFPLVFKYDFRNLKMFSFCIWKSRSRHGLVCFLLSALILSKVSWDMSSLRNNGFSFNTWAKLGNQASFPQPSSISPNLWKM
jgi:hypothetical protein